MTVSAVRSATAGFASTDAAGPAAIAASRIETQLRGHIRAKRLDPVTDRHVVEALIADLVADDEELSSSFGSDHELSHTVTRILERRIGDSSAGLGPLQPYFDDPTVEELWINEPGRVFIARRGVSELTNTILGDEQVRDLVERMLMTSGRRLDLSQPFVDATLADGSRLHVVIPDITRRHWAVNIRKFVLPAVQLEELVTLGALTAAAAAFLEASVAAGLNIVVAGGTQAGKTTMLNCLAAAVPGRERIITCEEVFELKLPAADWVALQTRQPNLEGNGEVPLRRLVKEALRMRPDRLIVGEVRQEEALDLLIALNSGVPGMATVHANSAREAVTKLCTLPLLAAGNISHDFVVPTVASAVDLVVHLAKDMRGLRRVREIAALSGRVESSRSGPGVIELTQLYSRDAEGRLVRGDGFPPHPERYVWAGFDLTSLLTPDRRVA
ncbi:MAG: type secretion system protein [Mycobacterium sp.]|nr:type secretion system protein [Mycobacterium sp.]